MNFRKLFLNFSYLSFTILWAYAAISKLGEFQMFKYQMADAPFVSPLADVLVYLVPGIELIVAGMFAIEKTQKLALYLSFVLITIFTIYVGAMVTFSSKAPCTCGGIISSFTWNQHLIFNAAFLVLSIFAIVVQRKQNQGGQSSIHTKVAY
uniref:MauE/DoxX family redox-associated membrane protein n=1 Tax=Pedobacter schmidteae TaxID=2201271 RepID=UPI000EAB87F7|nr:MauE/DoxX family redox-associated membrane protein [Pedobacter schmidteae]